MCAQIEYISGLQCRPRIPNPRKLLEMRFTEFLALPVYPWLAISQSASETELISFRIVKIIVFLLFPLMYVTINL